MMNMALCASIQEGEHGALRVYNEILMRWPYALEAASEIAKMNGTLDVGLVSLKSKLNSRKEGANVTVEEQCVQLSTNALLESYKRWQQQLSDNRGGRALWQESEANLEEALKSEKFWSEDSEHPSGQPLTSAIGISDDSVSSTQRPNPSLPQASLYTPVLRMRPVRSVNDPMKYLCAIQQEMFRGRYANIEALMKYAKGVDHAPWFGLEYFAWALLRVSNAEALNTMVTALQKLCPSRWETWYACALRDWMTPPRNVTGATELLNRCIVAQPTHPLLLITRAYMHVYKVKDSNLKYLLDQNMLHKNKLAADSRLALESARDAFSYSKDPFCSASLLHIYTLLSSQIPDAKYLEILGDVEGLSPVFKRYKKNPASILQYAPDAPITPEHIATANATLLNSDHPSTSTDEKDVTERAKSQNAHLASLYSRLLGYRAKMCIAKPALVSMGQECAEHALKLDPKNAMAHCALIVAKHTKRADWNGALEEITTGLQKADTREAQLLYRLEMLQTLDKLGEPDPQTFAEISTPMLTANRMDEDAVFWAEYVNIKIRKAEEDATEEEEMGIEDEM